MRVLLPLALLLGTLPALAAAPRPELLDYPDAQSFVAALLAWHRSEASTRKEPLPTAAPDTDWHHVTGPEDLDQALENARGYVQPRYKEPRRFNRSTHVSFPLPPLAPEELDAPTGLGGTAPASPPSGSGSDIRKH